MVEYLLVLLKGKFKVATLSRGYKRRTKGYALANEKSTALEIGDEPMQFHIKHPDVPVAVGEERVAAVPLLLHDRPGTQAIILDDAFQHRSIKAGLNILLTDFNNLFTEDTYLPAGSLRDLKSNYKRAQVIVVTKCPADLTKNQAERIREAIRPLAAQQLYFSYLAYGTPFHILGTGVSGINKKVDVLLVTGIANPQSLELMLRENAGELEVMHYRDHHIYTIDDFKAIKKKWDSLHSNNKILLTTEKDAVRLIKFREELSGLPLFIIPVRHEFLFDGDHAFNNSVVDFITNFKL